MCLVCIRFWALNLSWFWSYAVSFLFFAPTLKKHALEHLEAARLGEKFGSFFSAYGKRLSLIHI